jgi:hypothetical protein
MRAIRVVLSTALLLTIFGAPARADRFDIDGLPHVGQTLTDHCFAGSCAAHSSFSDLESETLLSDFEFNNSTASFHLAKLSSQKEDGSIGPHPAGGNRCGEKKPNRGRCSEDWEQRHSGPEPPQHSVPEPGTLLLMGVGVAAGGLFALRKNRAL